MPWSIAPVSTDDLLDSYAEYIRIKHPANYDRFRRSRDTSRESALAEAVVFQMLHQLGVDPQINDTVQSGGADFICNGSYRSPVLRRFATPNLQDRFVVEATSLDLEAVTNRSGIPDELEDGEGGAFSLLTHSIRAKASAKATQLANYDMPRVLAIASSHAGISALFNTATAEWCLTSEPQLRAPIDGGPITEATDLRSSVFLRFGQSGMEPCRQSISAILLISVHGDRSSVSGVLHPEPARSLNIRMLPNIPFIRLAKWPVNDGVLRTEWVIGEPELRDVRHQRVSIPELEGGILLSVDEPPAQVGE